MIQKVLDTRGALRCVRLESGDVGVMDARGRARLMVGAFAQLTFAGNGFLRVLHQADSEANRPMMAVTVGKIEDSVAASLKREAAKARRAAKKEREALMAALAASVPFAIGNKWGLRHQGRMVVPPLYRRVEPPVGRYCAVETYPGIWGVMAVDGKMEVEPRYEQVMLHPDGTVDLTVRSGKVITKKLP